MDPPTASLIRGRADPDGSGVSRRAELGLIWVGQPLLMVLSLTAADAFVMDDRALHLLWPALGILLAFTLHSGMAALIPGGVALLAVQVWTGPALATAVPLTLASVLAVGLNVPILKRLQLNDALCRIRDVLILFATVLLAPLVPAVVGGIAAHQLSDTPFTVALLLCWIAGSLGTLVSAPLLVTGLAAIREQGPLQVLRPDWEGLCLVFGTPLATYAIYGGLVSDQLAMPLSYAVFPLLIVAALRRTPLMVTVLLLLTGVVAFNCTLQDKGPFAAAADPPVDLLSLYAQYGLLSLTALLLAAGRQERLAAELRARTHFRALERASKLNVMGTLAAGLAHELNQPLCALSSYAALARRQIHEDPGTASRTLDRIIGVAERASGIVGRVRGLAHAEREEAASEQNLNVRIRELMDLLRPEIERRGIALHLDLERSPLRVRAPTVDLQQMLTNPVQNAWEAVAGRPAGDRWIRIRSRRVQASPWVDLMIDDSGPGFADTDRERLFEPLVTGRTEGTGLGLAITRGIVNDLGGEVFAEDPPGRGARVRIRLPLVSEAQRSVA